MAEEGCKLFVYGVDQNMANGDIQVDSFPRTEQSVRVLFRMLYLKGNFYALIEWAARDAKSKNIGGAMCKLKQYLLRALNTQPTRW